MWLSGLVLHVVLALRKGLRMSFTELSVCNSEGLASYLRLVFLPFELTCWICWECGVVVSDAHAVPRGGQSGFCAGWTALQAVCSISMFAD